ncbi:hypothetical protein BDV98DRAFT_107413 [Pterulicium gracile]|uniref:Uncharacterized protein n=1 Tax=Pterulicium gracile TaxID=1884261 RepID=A0A5C3QQL1_9AGAR|nr:hypothetical protein BDV98DRAFT_107413 [Pterula gracilis]
MKNAQDHLETQLFQEYQAILDKYRDKIHAAQTKATMTGATGLSHHEANMLNHGYADELRKFNQNRVVPAWGGLVAQQQSRLRELQVPGMVMTSSPAEREKQRKIIHVLEGLLVQ